LFTKVYEHKYDGNIQKYLRFFFNFFENKGSDGGSDESKHATHFRMVYLYCTSSLRVTDEFQAVNEVLEKSCLF
jgi:hypothetical protein